jgi:AhpD family alkylhydroperoxidase
MQGGKEMDRKQVYKEIEDTLGVVPTFFRAVPDSTLELEWHLMKSVQMEPGPIPNKYRELIGLAMSAATRCRYCTFFHTEMAKLNGATDAEIEDAVHFAKSSAGWSTYLNGLQLDFEQFRTEILKAVQYAHSQMKK